jgi:hypothetical protein
MILIFIIINTFVFTSTFKLTNDYGKYLNNRMDFDIEFEDLYDTSLNYNFKLKEREFETSNLIDIFNYFDFSQPGFKIHYRFIDDKKDIFYVKNSFDSFHMIIDDYIILNMKDLYFGIYFNKEYFSTSFWFKVNDFYDSAYALTLKNKDLFGISLNFQNHDIKPYLFFKNIYLNFENFNLNEIIIMEKEFNIYYNIKTGNLNINSFYFEKHEDNFIIRFPINKNIFLSYSNDGIGISISIQI